MIDWLIVDWLNKVKWEMFNVYSEWEQVQSYLEYTEVGRDGTIAFVYFNFTQWSIGSWITKVTLHFWYWSRGLREDDRRWTPIKSW
jgi:hypothetical protein